MNFLTFHHVLISAVIVIEEAVKIEQSSLIATQCKVILLNCLHISKDLRLSYSNISVDLCNLLILSEGLIHRSISSAHVYAINFRVVLRTQKFQLL
jgi:hypothetical protein